MKFFQEYCLLRNIVGHSQKFKRKRLQDKFWVATFLIKDICSKTFVFFDLTVILNFDFDV